ncbi:hypothetical protein ACWA1C_20325 [Flectobacillus roseus]
MDKDLIDKIPLYVRGILPPDEQKFIQEQIKVDPELAEEVKLQAGIMNAFKRLSYKKIFAEIAEEIQEEHVAEPIPFYPNSIQDNEPNQKKAIPFRLPLSLAAGLLIIVGSWVVYQSFFMEKNSSPDYLMNGHTTNQALIVPTLPKGMKNSHINDKAWVKDSTALYQAVQQLIDNSADMETLSLLGKLSKSQKNQALKLQAEWYLSIYQWNFGDRNEALNLWRNIINSTDSPYKEDAKIMLTVHSESGR